MKILNNIQCQSFIDKACQELADYIISNNLSGITTGISGGIDSSVVSVLGLQTIKKLGKAGYGADYKYLFMDCESDQNDLLKAKELADNFSFNLGKVDLTSWFRQSPLLDLIPKNNNKARIAQGNLKVRLRMACLYQTALLNNYIYLDTDDLSEKWMGFWTRHGDEGDVKIIQNITKTEVYDLGEYLGIPEVILRSPPGDGINVTPKNQAIEQLGLDYLLIEYIISRFIGEGFDYNGNSNQLKLNKFIELEKKVAFEIEKDQKAINKILEQALKTGFKRKYGDYAPNLAFDRKSFGFVEVGTKAFNDKYLSAIIKQNG